MNLNYECLSLKKVREKACVTIVSYGVLEVRHLFLRTYISQKRF